MTLKPLLPCLVVVLAASWYAQHADDPIVAASLPLGADLGACQEVLQLSVPDLQVTQDTAHHALVLKGPRQSMVPALELVHEMRDTKGLRQRRLSPSECDLAPTVEVAGDKVTFRVRNRAQGPRQLVRPDSTRDWPRGAFVEARDGRGMHLTEEGGWSPLSRISLGLFLPMPKSEMGYLRADEEWRETCSIAGALWDLDEGATASKTRQVRLRFTISMGRYTHLCVEAHTDWLNYSGQLPEFDVDQGLTSSID